MVFELSLITIATFLLVYLRGNYASLSIPLKMLPSFAIYSITSAYPVFKIIWLAAIFYRAKRE